MKTADEVMRNLQDHSKLFLMMCPPADAKFLVENCEDGRVEDYVRLGMISVVFGLRGAFLRIMSETEEHGMEDDVVEYLEKIKHDYITIEKWVEDFIAEIPDEQIKSLAREEWARKSSKIDIKKFDLKKLF